MSNGVPWSADDSARLRRLVASGLTDAQIADDMDRDRIVILRKRQELQLEPGQSAAMTAMLRRVNAMRRSRIVRV
jgi:hypothetical protein